MKYALVLVLLLFAFGCAAPVDTVEEVPIEEPTSSERSVKVADQPVEDQQVEEELNEEETEVEEDISLSPKSLDTSDDVFSQIDIALHTIE